MNYTVYFSKNTRAVDWNCPGVCKQLFTLRKLGVLVEKGGDHIPDPGEGASTDYPDETDDDKNGVILVNTLDYSVDSPNEIDSGEAENELYYPRKIVDSFDEIFHCVSPMCFLAVGQ